MVDSNNNTDLKSWQRALWGGLGGLLPFAIRLAGQSHIAESITRPGGGYNFANGLITAVVLAGVGAIVSAAFQDEKNRLKLLVLGVSAPALINTWAGYSTASEVAQQIDNRNEIQRNNGRQPPPSPDTKPATNSYLELPGFGVHTVHAADKALKTFSKSEVSLADQVRGVFTGVVRSENYFVIIGSFATQYQAENARKAVTAKLTGRDISLFAPPSDSKQTLVSVVAGVNLPFDQAQALRQSVADLGFPSAYVWTFGLPLKKWEPRCATVKLNERTWSTVKPPGADKAVTLAIGDLFRIDRGPDASTLYVVNDGDLYSGHSNKFDKSTPEPPAAITTRFGFSTPKALGSFTAFDHKFEARIASISHACIGVGCQTATVEICEEFGQ